MRNCSQHGDRGAFGMECVRRAAMWCEGGHRQPTAKMVMMRAQSDHSLSYRFFHYGGQKPMKQGAMLIVLSLLFLSMSCTTALRNNQLEAVAKDWALVIRASQVIPVYPLSEDLQPGDVLLVSIPVEDQVALYKEKGFLPLDQHLVRLYSEEYKEFYRSRYGISDQRVPPAHWQEQDAEGNHNWKIAPHAAFPTYQFSVRTGSGLNLAIPIQGVPFALGLMNSGKASGTVTIADAYTFGLDNSRLEKLVRDWAKKNRSLLRNYQPVEGKYHFLRVVSRVYVTGRVSVAVHNEEANAAEGAVGANRPVELMAVEPGSPDKNYAKSIEVINKFAADQLPGAKVKIATATSRSVTLSEEFERPLIVGYVGFDMPIQKGGRLGAPISTLAQLTKGRTLPARSPGNVYRLAALAHMYQALNTIPGTEGEAIRGELDSLDRLLPERYPFSLYEFTSPTEIQKDTEVVAGVKIDVQGFQAIVDFLGYANTTVETLERYLPMARQETEEQRRAVSHLEQELQSARAARQEIGSRLNGESALMEAIDFVFLGS